MPIPCPQRVMRMPKSCVICAKKINGTIEIKQEYAQMATLIFITASISFLFGVLCLWAGLKLSQVKIMKITCCEQGAEIEIIEWIIKGIA